MSNDARVNSVEAENEVNHLLDFARGVDSSLKYFKFLKPQNRTSV